MSTPSVSDVRKFWNSRPLWTGESNFEPGSKEFFEEHRQVIIDDCLAGKMDQRILPEAPQRKKVLDLGCGIGFWVVELGELGCESLTAADLSSESLALAKKRASNYGIEAEFFEENAENLNFADGSFSHVNCQGVIHHTPNTEACVKEIARVLEPGGTASVSVYYKNFFLENWDYLRPVGKLLFGLGAKLKGRGRENIFAQGDINEIVRLYDGAENPVGKAYSYDEFRQMLEPYFEIDEFFLHFFPARAFPFGIPKSFHRYMDKKMGFMLYSRLRKRG